MKWLDAWVYDTGTKATPVYLEIYLSPERLIAAGFTDESPVIIMHKDHADYLLKLFRFHYEFTKQANLLDPEAERIMTEMSLAE